MFIPSAQDRLLQDPPDAVLILRDFLRQVRIVLSVIKKCASPCGSNCCFVSIALFFCHIYAVNLSTYTSIRKMLDNITVKFISTSFL
jgi:hypothetical protein